MPGEGPNPDRVRAALEELLGWQGIARSPQLAELLRYVVEKTLNGEGAGIKAYSIAVDVFGRPPDFDPQSDPIVRVQARRLRTLIEQFYAVGSARADVEILLPLGRYIPEFREVASKPVAEQAKPEPAVVVSAPVEVPPLAIVPRDVRPRRFFTNAVIGLAFTFVGVGLTILTVRWLLPQQVTVERVIPEMPHVSIGTFDNLTGEPVLDDDVRQVGVRVGEGLRKFENLAVADDGLLLSGTVQLVGGQYVLHAMLTQRNVNVGIWTTTITAPDGKTDTEALTAAGNVLVAQVGTANGPLHAQARAWLDMQSKLPDEVTSYLCDLIYMRWRDNRRLVDAADGAACYDKILAKTPDDPIALAADAGMRAWQKQFLATPTDDLSGLMADETVAAGRAVTLSPQSSFVYEQQAVVLARQGSVDAALGSARKGVELNPANMDVVTVLSLLDWVDGNFVDGVRLTEQAIDTLQTAPPRYYIVRAFNALREERFFDAIDAAQALASGDEEFGPVIALAAAPRAGRQDLVDRYRPVVMNNKYYQVAGILPRLAMRMHTEATFAKLREGLVLAGIPANALDHPFNADGSAQATATP